MARKNVLQSYKFFDAEDASIGQSTQNDPTEIDFLDNVGVQVNWTGTPVGEFKVWGSNDKANPKAGVLPVNWTQFDFATPIVIDATNTSLIIAMKQVEFSWLYFEYIPASGAGTISATVTIKSVGA